MSSSGRRFAALSIAAIWMVTPAATAHGAGSTAAASPSTSRDGHHRIADPAVVLAWERTAIRTIYAEAATPIPVGVLYLGFTSVAMYEAAQTASRRGRGSKAAAVAVAAHGVLKQYFPGSSTSLDADLAASLAAVPDGPAEAKGIRIGRAAAAEMIASRVGDGRELTVVYDKEPAPGVWQPAPGGAMLGANLGFVRPLVLSRRVRVDGPDALDSARYAAQYDEVPLLGGATSTLRTQEQTDTALFFNSNSATMVGDALIRRLEQAPMGLRRSARIFASMHAAMTDSLITCFRLKYDVGFWRPSQAIAGAATDGNDATAPEAGWTSLVPDPPYSDYVSGHACLTAPAVEVIRRMLGETTPLELLSVNSSIPRTYATLSDLEDDAFHARIWSGLHFRTAMEDGYQIGHHTAAEVLTLIRER